MEEGNPLEAGGIEFLDSSQFTSLEEVVSMALSDGWGGGTALPTVLPSSLPLLVGIESVLPIVTMVTHLSHQAGHC